MRSFLSFQHILGGVGCALALSACMTAPVAPAPPKLDDLLAKAVLELNAGRPNGALALWSQAATAYPSEKEPWLRIAQTKYDDGQYGAAIVNAQEGLVRDPNDKLANSIIAISGLRLSTRALSDLSRQNNISGSLRRESQDLAKLLRESLGETVLVPSKVVPPIRGRAKTAGKAPVRSGSDETSANPFSGLK